jgi:hypothetical protein
VAGGNNQSFKENPLDFMRRNFIHTASNGHVMGVGQFGIKRIASAGEHGGAGVMLGNFTSTSYFAHPLGAFFLLAQPQHDNVAALPNTVDFMFTNHMNGCQFLAYGPDRHNLTIEHNNYFGGVGGSYAGRRAVLDGHAFVFTLEPGGTSGALGGGRHGYIAQGGANVIGVRDAALGWQFFVRTHADAPFPAPVSGPH